MQSHEISQSFKEPGQMPARVWPREEIIRRARELLRTGGVQGRRELVSTLFELERLLRETFRQGRAP